MRAARFVLGWVGSVILGNAAAIIAATLLQAETLTTVLAVAALEGCVLGLGQRWLFSRMLPGHTLRWFQATVAGMLIGRGIQFAIDTGPLLPLSYRWPEAAQFLAAAGAGLGFGAVMALPQALALRGRIPHAEIWVAARGAGMAVVLASLFAASHALGGLQTGPVATFAILLALLSVCGILEGAIEGSVLSWLLAPSHTHRALADVPQPHYFIRNER